MPSVISKYVSNKAVASAASISIFFLIIHLKQKSRKKLNQSIVRYVVSDKSPKKSKAQVDKRFFKQLRYLLGIVIPSPFSKEFAFLLLVALSLVSRSLCDLWLIQQTTKMESSIINMDKDMFIKDLFHFFGGVPLLAVVNNILKYSIGELKIRFRDRLANHLYNQYLKGLTYYRMSNLDSRMVNVDQVLTTDVDKFCHSVADLYSNVSKPVLDILIYVYRLTITVGPQTPAVLLAYLLVSGLTLTRIRRPIARLTAEEQRLEGEHRFIHSRLIANSEEIAFYQGVNREKLTMVTSLQKLINHLRSYLEFSVMMGIIDNIMGKYIATMVGFVAVSLPFMNSSHPVLSKVGKNQRFGHYYVYGRMLLKLAEAIGRLVLSGRELTRLAGFTARVSELCTVLQDLNKGTYTRTQVLENTEICLSRRGQIIFKDNIISFDRVPLVTPNGEVLIQELTFTVHAGNNVLVCGPNGCGKSSMFRVLGELWPLFGGTLTKPPSGKLFYIPQRPYMTLGTLRDQVIYPHSEQEMKRRGFTDADLSKHLERVQLSYLLERSGGWDNVDDWIDVLSGGEKQRIAMARLFYHKPQFAILDECTSAVSVDVEGSMYQHCRNVGITLFTISHRRSLWKHHEFSLHMDGRGNYEYKPISPDTEEFGS